MHVCLSVLSWGGHLYVCERMQALHAPAACRMAVSAEHLYSLSKDIGDSDAHREA